MKTDVFAKRHIGITAADREVMLKKIGVGSLEELIDRAIPSNIRLKEPLKLAPAMTEREFLEHANLLASENKAYTSYIGYGWYDCITPGVIQRNVLENPVWYTSYTPYQTEVSQGRLEALINFQTVISDLTALPLANCSLLDEATAAAEAMTMMALLRKRKEIKAGKNILFVDEKIFGHNLAVIKTRGIPQGVEIVTGDFKTYELTDKVFGCILQYPNSDGSVEDYREFVEKAHGVGARVAVDADILSLALLTPPGEWGADIAFGTSQRLGVPMYYGGPSAGYMATKMEYKRDIPGRIIGITKDKYGREAYRLALQTREQHIKRERASSNICTAQALLATVTSFYAVYHGPEGIRQIAQRIHDIAVLLDEKLSALGYKQHNKLFFDTLRLTLPEGVTAEQLRTIALGKEVNLRYFENGDVGLSIDETTTIEDVNILLQIFSVAAEKKAEVVEDVQESLIEGEFARTSKYLTHPVFNKYHRETEMMRYIKRLERKDISLTHTMISLGSCTMKGTPSGSMIAFSNPGWMNIHPLAPKDQARGYQKLIANLSKQLEIVTGFAGCTLQPNSGAAGEYAGLRTIRAYFEAKGETKRHIVLIPSSAHGTNPASCVQAGYTPLICACDDKGNVDVEDLRQKAEENKDELAALMITYPSTHGIFEPEIAKICEIIHSCGAQVYMDGANMNAQCGLTNPGTIGADVCHLNLHKTFSSPHGGGGPGVGPICVAEHLVPFLPGHAVFGDDSNEVSAAPYGSAGILPITYGYLCMMGAEGLAMASATAILSSNYLAAHFQKTFGVVYTGATGFVGHEMILDCRYLRDETGIDEGDISKRMMDYGYHAPTISFPVHSTFMIEPTESESLEELDNFIDMMDHIWEEIMDVKEGRAEKDDNVLINAPHPEYEVVANEWNHCYSREKAAYPMQSVRDNKFWLNVARCDDAFGDRNLEPRRI